MAWTSGLDRQALGLKGPSEDSESLRLLYESFLTYWVHIYDATLLDDDENDFYGMTENGQRKTTFTLVSFMIYLLLLICGRAHYSVF